ncbi:MAG: porin [Myxococcota bacterium]
MPRIISFIASLLLAALPAAAKEPSGESALLVPDYELKLLGDHAVDPATIRFRPGKGLEIRSKDKRFSLITRVRGQFLYTLEKEAGELPEHGLQLRRARLVFAGNMFDPHVKYKVELALSPGDMAVQDGIPRRTPILDWYMDFDWLRELALRVGQYKVPYNRQRVVSSGDLQLVDRSIANSEFNLDRDIGLDVRSTDFLGLGRLRYYAGIYIGEGRDAFRVGDLGLMYLARVEVLPLGGFSDYVEGDFERTGPRVSLGAAYAFLDEAKGNRGILGSRPRDGGTTDYHNGTADLVFKLYGLSLTSEIFARYGVRNPGNAEDEDGNPVPADKPRNGYGVFLQGGYMLPWLPVEVAARYSQVRPNDPARSSLAQSEELGGGLSFYPGHHSLKVQADAFRIWSAGNITTGTDHFRIQLQAAL